jgi:hypothetical protein
MTNLRNLYLATAFAASLPAMAASPTPVVIGFETTATPASQDYDGNITGGGGGAVDINYAAYGVTFDSKAFSFYSSLNSKANFGLNVDNLPPLYADPVANQALLDKLSGPARLDVLTLDRDANGNRVLLNEVVMSAYQVSRSCTDTGSCPPADPSLSTIISIDAINHPYSAVSFWYSADNGANGQVNYGLISMTTGATQIVAGGSLTPNAHFASEQCIDPATGNPANSSMWWCEWNQAPTYTAPTGWALQTIEFKSREGAILYDNIILTPPSPTPEPSTYALTLFGLVGIRFLAVRRRRPN